MLRLYAIAASISVVAFFVDQATKQLGRGLTPGVGPFSQFATFVWHENHGLIANIPVPLPLIIFVTFMVLGLVLWLLSFATCRRQTMAVIGLGLLIGGAVGNLVDRIVLGYVFDWILLFGRSAFNVADVCILVGVLTYLAGTRRVSTCAVT